MSAKQAASGQILLLLLEGFAETQATLYVSTLREAGLPLKTVGLSRRPVSSEHGMEILPDLSIDAVIRALPSPELLLVPAGRVTASIWGADPRIRLLLRLIQQGGGYVVASTELMGVLKGLVDADLPLAIYLEPPDVPSTAPFTLHVFVAPSHYAAQEQFVHRLVQFFTRLIPPAAG